MDRTTTDTPVSAPAAPLASATRPPAIGVLYTVEGLCSIGGNLLQVGIFFYTNRRFGWGLRENFTLAAAQGAVYVAGALFAHRLSSRVAPRRALAGLYAALTLVALAPVFADSRAGVVASVLVYTATMALCWPILESLVSVGLDAHALSRRISAYNLVWAGTAVLALAVNGAVIDNWPAGVFVITATVHGLSALILLTAGRGGGGRAARRAGAEFEPPASPELATPARSGSPTPGVPPSASHLDPEPELLRARTVALWLSRISLPASYALVYALSALLPSLPPVKQIPTWAATLVGSAWLAARWAAFLTLGLHDWWHTRPRALLAAAWLMVAAFGACAWQPSSVFATSNALALDLAWLVLCQVVIGFTIGLIYSASLYFGMVLSEGSTEHSGYHEALIGLGSVLGPGAGAVAQWLRPGTMTPGVVAVAGVLLASTVLATGASVVADRRRAR